MANGDPPVSLFSRIRSAVTSGINLVRAGVARGLDATGITSLLRRTGFLEDPQQGLTIVQAPGAPRSPQEALERQQERLRLVELAQEEARAQLELVEEARSGRQDEIEAGRVARSLGPSEVVPESVMAIAQSRMRREYAWVVRAPVTDRVTGRTRLGYVTVVADSNLPVGLILSRARYLFEASPTDVGEMAIEGVRRAGVQGTLTRPAG